MGRKSRALREELEWRGKYCKEATGIIMDLMAEFRKSNLFLPPEMMQRISRLRQATAVWTAIKLAREHVENEKSKSEA